MSRSAESKPSAAPPTVRALGPLGRFGEGVVRRASTTLQFVGDLSATLVRGLTPGNWRRTMREEFGLFLHRVGIRAIPAVVVSALLVGIGLVLQIIYWLDVAGQEGRVGDFLVLVLIREIAPIVTALIVIGRSGSVMLDEVGHLTVNGQIRMLESHGIDPTDYIAIPRVFATALSLFMLTMFFMYTALWSGYLAASIAGLTSISLLEFVDEVLSGMTLGDHVLLLVKPTITGFVIGYIAVWLGLRVEPTALAVRRALPQGFVYSLVATFVVGAAVSAVA